MLISFKQLSESTRNQMAGELEPEQNLNWLMSEVLRSLPSDAIENAQIRQEFNVQLMIDNIVVEPQLLGDILCNIEEYIQKQGEYLMRQKLQELECRFNDIFLPLENATKDATQKIKEEFSIIDDND